jgi:predicted aspartyl protease
MEETMHNSKQTRNTRKYTVGCISIALLLFVIATTVIWLGERVNPDAKAQLKIGDSLYQEGRSDEAEVAYLNALALAPGNPAALEKLGLISLWRNDTQEAESYFIDALNHTPWYRNFWPLNTNLKYHLGMTYLRQDRFSDLTQLFYEARGPIAIGPFRDLDSFGKQMELFGNEAPYTIEGPDETRIDFVITDPLPVIEVSVNGSAPQNFVLDTGGMEVILDDDLAEQVGAQIAGSITGSYGGGKKAETGLGRLDSIALGEFVVHNLPIHILDTDSISSEFGGMKIKGIIGTRLLMHFLTTIDYPNGALILQRPTPANLQSLDSQISAVGAKVIPFWLIETHYIVAWGTINNLDPMLFFVDTGLAGAGFIASEPRLQEEAGISVDWTKAEEGIGGGGAYQSVDVIIDRLTLGTGENEVVKNQVLGKVSESPPSVLGDTLGFYIGGLISHQFFRDHALTLDFTDMNLILQ